MTSLVIHAETGVELRQVVRVHIADGRLVVLGRSQTVAGQVAWGVGYSPDATPRMVELLGGSPGEDVVALLERRRDDGTVPMSALPDWLAARGVHGEHWEHGLG